MRTADRLTFPCNSDFVEALKIVLDFEGGFVDDVNDPGGVTNYGITQKVYDAWLSSQGHKTASVRLIQSKDVYEIYHAQYWTPIQGDLLPKNFALCLFDFAVHSGPSKAIRTLQRILCVEDDGILGFVTLNEILKIDEKILIRNLLRERMLFLQNLSVWKYYKNGWTNRLHTLESICVKGPVTRIPNVIHQNFNIEDSGKKALAKKTSLFKNRAIQIGGGIGIAEVLKNLYLFMSLQENPSRIIAIVTSAFLLLCLAYLLYVNFKEDLRG